VIFRGVLTLLLAAAAACAHAQQYRWVDENGRTQYSDTPPPVSAKNVQKIDVKGGAPAGAAEVPFELSRVQKDFPVTLYTSPICKEPCEGARALLNRRGVPFKEIQVWDTASNDELQQVSGGNRVPVLIVGRSVQNGFGASEYNALLDSAGYPAAGVLPTGSQGVPPLPQGYAPPAEGESQPAAQPVAPEAPQKAGPSSPRFTPDQPQRPGPYAPGSGSTK